MSPRLKDIVSLIITWAIMATGMFFWFREIDRWASNQFANPLMASALVGVMELAVLGLAFCLASPVSRLARWLLGLLPGR